MLSHFSPVQLFVTLWTVALQAPLSLGILQAKYWSGLPLRTQKKIYNLRVELSFTWAKMRTVAREAGTQRALRDCSKVTVGEGQYIRSW